MRQKDFYVIADILLQLRWRIPATDYDITVTLFTQQLATRFPRFNEEEFRRYIETRSRSIT